MIDRLNDVVFLTPPAFPVTLSVYVPTAAELFVLRVSTVEQLALQLEDENDEVTLAGRPETLNETDLERPGVKIVLILVETADPWLVATLPELAIVKSKFLCWVLCSAMAETS